jgi:hypothetical protein
VRRIIVPFFVALLITSSPNAQAQSRMQDPAMAAAGPEFCPRGPCPGSEQVAALQRSISQKGPKPEAAPKPALFPPNPYQSAMTQPKNDGDKYVSQIPKTNIGKTPSSLNLSGDDKVRAPQPDPGAYGAQIEARSRQMFPWISQEQERQRWMAEQEQQAIANDINNTKPLVYPVAGR